MASSVRLVNRTTGSVVVVDEDKADRLAEEFSTLGLVREESANKAPAKKAAAKRSSSKS